MYKKIDRLNYIMIIFVILINIILSFYQNINVSLYNMHFLKLLIAIIATLSISRCYKLQSENSKNTIKRQTFCYSVSCLFHSVSILIICTFTFSIFSYLVASFNFPLCDAIYDKFDKFIGFNWMNWFDVLKSNSYLSFILMHSYHSIIPQMIIIVVLLAFQNKIKEIKTLIFLFLYTAFITILLSGLFPAYACYHYYNITSDMLQNMYIAAPYNHINHVLQLRTGVMTTLPSADAFEGIITFPSFHASLAVIFMIASRNIKLFYLNWAFFILNILVLISTPHNGGHYLVDVIAGVLIVLILFVIYKATLKKIYA